MADNGQYDSQINLEQEEYERETTIEQEDSELEITMQPEDATVYGGSVVNSINGQVGDVVLTTSDLENTSDYQTGAQVQSAIAGKQNVIADLPQIRSGAEAGATAVQPEDLARIATTGSYNDSLDKPSVNNVALIGDISLDDLGIQPKGNYALESDIPDVSNFITKDVNNLTNYTLKTNTGSLIDLEINQTTYVVTLKLKNQDGTVISTDTIDLPLENVVVSGSYDETNKKIVLTLQSGDTVDIPVGALISGLQSEITSSNKLASDLVDDSNSGNKFVTISEKQTWNGKANISDIPTKTSQLTNDSNYVTNTDYASSSTAGVVKVSNANAAGVSSVGTLFPSVLSYLQYTSGGNWMFIGKGTLENVIEGKGLITSSSDITGNASTSTTLKAFNYNRKGTSNTWAKVATASLVGTWEEKHAYLFVKGTHNTNFKQNGIISIDAAGNAIKSKVKLYSAQFISASTDLDVENFYIEYQDGDANTNATINFWVKNTTNAYASWQFKILQNAGWTIESANTSVATLPTQDFTGKFSELNNKTLNDKDGNDITTTYVKNTEIDRIKATLPTTTGSGEEVTLEKTAELDFVKPPLPRGNTKQDTTTGKNLLQNTATSQTISGVTFTVNSDKSVTCNGTATANAIFRIVQAPDFPDNEDMLLTGCPVGGSSSTYQLQYSNNRDKAFQDMGNGIVIQKMDYNIYPNTYVQIRIVKGYTCNNLTFYPMIRLATIEDDTYEPYTGGIPSPNPDYPQEIRNVTGNVGVTISNGNNTESKTLPVSLGNIELCKIGNYQDYLYKASNKWYLHKEIKKILLNGTEGWSISNNVFYLTSISDYINSSGKICLSDKYIAIDNTNVGASAITQNNSICFFSTNTNPRLYIRDERFNNVNAFKAELSENNVKVYYPTVTPTDTEITDATLISQLEEISKTLSYQGQTNITSNTITMFDVEAYQSAKLILEDLDLTKLSTFDNTKTQILKNINGSLIWVNE